jgi:hypothetical protein
MKFKTNEAYLSAISNPPLPEMIRQNNDGSLYIPISVIQDQLLFIYDGFTQWTMERESFTKGGLIGVGILKYKHPIMGDWLSVSGTAAIPWRGGLRLDYPSLEGHCILNAAKKIGVWFGQNLNRETDDAPYQEHEIESRESDRIKDLIDGCETMEELAKFKDQASKQGAKKYYIDKLKSLV